MAQRSGEIQENFKAPVNSASWSMEHHECLSPRCTVEWCGSGDQNVAPLDAPHGHTGSRGLSRSARALAGSQPCSCSSSGRTGALGWSGTEKFPRVAVDLGTEVSCDTTEPGSDGPDGSRWVPGLRQPGSGPLQTFVARSWHPLGMERLGSGRALMQARLKFGLIMLIVVPAPLLFSHPRESLTSLTLAGQHCSQQPHPLRSRPADHS